MNIILYLILKRHIEKILKLKEYYHRERSDQMHRVDWCFHELLIHEDGHLLLYVEVWEHRMCYMQLQGGENKWYDTQDFKNQEGVKNILRDILTDRFNRWFGNTFILGVKFVDKTTEWKRKTTIHHPQFESL